MTNSRDLDLRALIADVFTACRPEWVLLEGNQRFNDYVGYLGHIVEALRSKGPADRPFAEVTLVDIGAGTGVVAAACARLGMTSWSVDNRRADSLEHARIREHFGVGYKQYNAVTDALDFPDGTFDVVNCNDMIEHIHGSPKRMLAECIRVLKPGGWLIVTTPNHAALHNRIFLLFGGSTYHSIIDWFHNPIWQKPVYTAHIREYTISEMRYMLAEAGFGQVEVRGADQALLGSVAADQGPREKLDLTGAYAHLAGRPVYDREFRIGSLRDLALVLYSYLTRLVPSARSAMTAYALKSRAG
jgi:2-polyprenyl-3-methyl-5-hydroxy-6-metoxy-1,4-benzoquinol methylase